MKNLFKIIFASTYLSVAALCAASQEIVSLESMSTTAQEDFYDMFYQLQEMNIIPKDLNLDSQITSLNSQTLLKLMSLMQQKPEIAPEKNQFTQILVQKLEQISYIELRNIIGDLKNSKTFSAIDKAKILTTLHEMHTFKAPNSTEQNPVYPFRKEIINIFIHISSLNNSSFSETQKKNIFALFMDNKGQDLLKIKESYPTCTIKLEEINFFNTIVKANIIQPSTLKKYLIKAAKIACIIAVVMIVGYILYKIADKIGEKLGKGLSTGIIQGGLEKLHVEIVSTDDQAQRIINHEATDEELGVITAPTAPSAASSSATSATASTTSTTPTIRTKTRNEIISEASTAEKRMELAQSILIRRAIKPFCQTITQGAIEGILAGALQAKDPCSASTGTSGASQALTKILTDTLLNELYKARVGEGTWLAGRLVSRPVNIQGTGELWDKPFGTAYEKPIDPRSIQEEFARRITILRDRPTTAGDLIFDIPASKSTMGYTSFTQAKAEEGAINAFLASSGKSALTPEEKARLQIPVPSRH